MMTVEDVANLLHGQLQSLADAVDAGPTSELRLALRQSFHSQRVLQRTRELTELGRVSPLHPTSGTPPQCADLVSREWYLTLAEAELVAGSIYDDSKAQVFRDQSAAKLAADLLTVEEAAESLSTGTGWKLKRWLKTLRDALTRRELPYRNPQDYSDLLPMPAPADARDWYDLVCAKDVNHLLEIHTEWAVLYRLPLHAQANSGSKIRASVSVLSRSADTRRDILSTPFERALLSARGKTTAEVFLVLRRLALAKDEPFTGEVADDGALIYRDDDGRYAKVTKDAVRKRLKRWLDKNR